MTQRIFTSLAEMKVTARASNRPTSFATRDGVELTVVPVGRGFRYLLIAQEIAESTAVANFDYISRRVA